MLTGLQCPRCHSDALYSYGRIKSGKQRYLCLLCNRQFVPGAERREIRNRPECPLCGSKTHVYMRNGTTIRFRCANYPECKGYIKQKV